MFLIQMILLLIIVCISSLKMMMRNKTGDISWGEPIVTILQVVVFICIVISVIFGQMIG